ncbi:MAG: C39 family peptidase [Chloroflexota bacterium]
MQKRPLQTLAIAIPVLCLLSVAVYFLPPVHNRLSARVENLQAQVKYVISPPDEAIFVPGNAEGPTGAAMASSTHSATPVPATATRTLAPDIPTFTAQPTQTPTQTPTHLPPKASLDGVIYVDQHGRWNYCGPSNLTMALNFWGWPGDRDDVARVVKPGVQDPEIEFIQQGKWDKNVMPYEMADFVNEQTAYRAIVRYGGGADLIKRLIAAGFPVIVEKGYFEADYTGKVAWMGHYLFTTGYDDVTHQFTVQDTYLKPGKDMPVDYEAYMEGWRSFNYLWMLVYPPEREAEVNAVIGPYSDEAWASQHALEMAEREIPALTGVQEFFAWFNKGTSLVWLQQYTEAAAAYDRAFALYAVLGNGDLQRPYRILWYQTGPYWAYHYSGRYQDVIDLANNTLNKTIAEPTLEESLYWRGMAEYALGQTDAAIADFLEAVRLNPNFGPGRYMLEQLGITP